MTLLHLDAGAHRSDESVTRTLSGEFATAWRAAHPGATYVHRDLATDPVAPIGSAYCALGRRLEREDLVPTHHVGALVDTVDERREWALTRPLVSELRAADTVVIGAPMYNFGVAAGLKAWIDRITFPGAYTDPDTGDALLAGTRVVVVTASGGAYGPGSPREGWDFQTPYLRTWLGYLGVGEIHMVGAELTMAGVSPHMTGLRETAASSLAAARARVAELVSVMPRGKPRGAGAVALGA